MLALNVLQGCRTVQLPKGYNALVDEQDWELVRTTAWQIDIRKTRCYVKQTKHISGSGKNRIIERTYLHRLIHPDKSAVQVDHRDGDGRNNTRDNLRSATRSQNQANRRCGYGSSRFKGVSFDKARGLWVAQIHSKSGQRHIGRYRNEEDAARAYDRVAIEIHGEFAATNSKALGLV